MKFVDQLRSFYAGLEPHARRNLWIALVSSVVGLVLLGFWASNQPWATLVSDRSYDELLATAAALDEQKIPYRINGDGTLDVRADTLGAARAAVTSNEQLPGLGDIGELKLGLTPDAQEWAFLRAREGDVARMVNGIEGITGAQINIVPRSDPLFLDDERPASASVFVRLAPGVNLSKRQVKAIANLCANAVEGLSADMVTVVDQRGNLLAEGDAGASASSDGPRSLLEYRGRLEQRHERAVTMALLSVLGDPTAFSVTASVELDETSSETVSKRVDPKVQALLKEQVEESTNGAAAVGGVPGVDANLPERAKGANGVGSASNRSATTSSFTYPTVDEVRRRPAGGVKRTSVAVQVDAAKLAALVGEGGSVEELQQRINEAVKAAVGFDEERGDTVSVGFLPFAERSWSVEAPASASMISAERAAPYAVSVLALLLFFGMVVRPLVRSVVAGPKPSAEPGEAGGHEAAGAGAGAPTPDDDLAGRLRELVDNYEPVDASDLNRLVERENEAAAEVLRRWQRGA